MIESCLYKQLANLKCENVVIESQIVEHCFYNLQEKIHLKSLIETHGSKWYSRPKAWIKTYNLLAIYINSALRKKLATCTDREHIPAVHKILAYIYPDMPQFHWLGNNVTSIVYSMCYPWIHVIFYFCCVMLRNTSTLNHSNVEISMESCMYTLLDYCFCCITCICISAVIIAWPCHMWIELRILF